MQKLIPYVDESGKNHWPIHIDVKTGVLYYMKKHNGRKVQFSTRCKKDQLVKAKRFANERLTEILGKKKTVRTTSLIKDELATWREVKYGEKLSKSTIANINNAIGKIEPFWGDKFPIDLLNTDLRSDWYKWTEETYPELQFENTIKYMRNFCGYLSKKVVNGVPIIPARPSFPDPQRKNVRRLRKRKTARIIEAEDFKKIYNTAADEDDRLACLFMYTMATRVSETLGLRFGKEILLDEETAIYRWSDGQNKADHDGEHALHPVLIEPLMALRKKRVAEGTELLFPQKNNNKARLKEQQIDWAGWRKRSNIGFHWTSHTFRRSCLTILFANPNIPQTMIMKLYRVSLKVALEHYIKTPKSTIMSMRDVLEVNL